MRAGKVVLMGAVALGIGFSMVSASACYSLRAGSGLPDHIRTFAVLPFDNETTRFELTEEVRQELERQLPRALGVRTSGGDIADAVVQGTITRYDVTAPLFRPGSGGDRAEVIEREVQITVRVEIVDRVGNVILWDDAALNVRGQYLDATEDEDVGRAQAIELLVQRIIDGAQSNW
jgi:hypothetical protein